MAGEQLQIGWNVFEGMAGISKKARGGELEKYRLGSDNKDPQIIRVIQ